MSADRDPAKGEQREGIDLTNLDQPLGPDAAATKRDLVDYLDAVADRMLPGLVGRPLTVLRALRGRAPFMQKNVSKYTPDWVQTVSIWAEASKREVRYALCNDRRTLLWLANQRAIEYHPTLGLATNIYRPTHLVLDLDPPPDANFAAVVTVAHLVRRALGDSGLAGAVKTSGAKGVHVFVPIDDGAPVEDVAAATRALAFTDSLRSLAPGGRLLVIGFTGGDIPTIKVNRLLLNNVDAVGVGWGAWSLTHPGYLLEQWAELEPLLASGKVSAPEPIVYPLERAGDAIASLEDRTAKGKVVVKLR